MNNTQTAIVCDTHPLTHNFGAFHHSETHAHDMTQQQAAAGPVQKFRTEHQEDCAVLAPSHPHLNARLAQRSLSVLCKAGLLGHATIFEQACDSRRVVWAATGDYEWSQVFAQISLGLDCICCLELAFWPTPQAS